MATISAFPALQCICDSNFHRRLSSSIHFLSLPVRVPSLKHFSVTTNANRCHGMRRVRSAEEGTLIPEKLEEAVAEASSSSSAKRGTWEEPDDGSGSGREDEVDEDEAAQDDWGAESDWEEDKDAPVAEVTTDSYEDDLVKEVVQLLEPAERAILQQNVAPNLDKISTAKWSPIHTLGLSGQIRFMDVLLESGVDIDAVNQDGLTALHLAIIGKKEAVISHLLRKGASPHVRDRDGATPLHYAVQVGALQTVKLLIKYKVDVNVADNEGWTPLHIAIQSRNRLISKILLVNGADRTRRTKDGKTALDMCLCYGKDFKSYELASFLKRLPAYDDL